MAKIKLNVAGMHCISCELLLEKGFEKIDGVHSCDVSHKKGVVEVECSDDVSLSDLESVVKACGYQVVIEHEKHKHKVKGENGGRNLIQIFFIVLGVSIVAFLLGKFEISKLFPEFGSNVGVFVALLLGIVASFSTCLVMVGGIVLGFGNVYTVHEDSKHPLMSRALPHLYFHAGRIGGFALLGGVLGLIGGKINYSLTFTGYLTIVVALMMLYIGLQIIGFVPNITKLGFHLPKKLSKKIHALEEKNHPLAPMVIGVLTFLLPCGFTQSMQIAAIASQSFFTGALIMGAFALGTFPALFSLGFGSSYAKKGNFGFLNKIIGVIVVFFAIYSFNSGLVLSGSSFTLDFWRSGNGIEATQNDDVQVIKMDVDWVFTPDEFVVKKGVPVRWEINGINISGCSNEIAIPKLGISQRINEGPNVIEFTPEETGSLPFSCWMGMIGGRFTVVE